MIAKKHPTIRVTTAWSAFDLDVVGIQIQARDAATGNVLCAAKTDRDLDTMTDEQVISWATAAVAAYADRQKRTRRAIAAERQFS